MLRSLGMTLMLRGVPLDGDWHFSPVACQLASPRGEHPTPRRGALHNKVRLFFFRPAGRFRDRLARQISAPLGSYDGESTGDPPVASLALALSPWPVRCALKVEKIESVSRVASPAPLGRRQSHPQEKKVQSIPNIFPMNSDLLYDSRNTPHT